MAAKAKARGKKKSARVAKPAPVTRKRQVGRPAKAADPVLVLREHRERLEALFQEAHKVHEVTLEGIRRLVEATAARAQRFGADRRGNGKARCALPEAQRTARRSDR
jgi:hypothetical protein